MFVCVWGGTVFISEWKFYQKYRKKELYSRKKRAYVDEKKSLKLLFMKPPAQQPGSHFSFLDVEYLGGNLTITNMFRKFAV